jgi:phosphate transport system permease protein
MDWATRKVLDRSFTGLGLLSVVLLTVCLLVILAPIVVRGARAFVFRGAIEFRRFEMERMGRGDRHEVEKEMAVALKARQFVYDAVEEFEAYLNEGRAAREPIAKMLEDFTSEYRSLKSSERRKYRKLLREVKPLLKLFTADSPVNASLLGELGLKPEVEPTSEQLRKLGLAGLARHADAFEGTKLAPLFTYIPANAGKLMGPLRYSGPLKELKKRLHALLGPFPEDPEPVLPRSQYGQTRWDRARVKLHDVLNVDGYDYSDPTKMGVKTVTPRAEQFKGTPLEGLFTKLAEPGVAEAMMRPRWVFYWRFLTDESVDSHMFGGIWPEMLGTFYLTIGAILFAVPTGVLSAVYLVEYAGDNIAVGFLRTFVSTLAGVPSIVFGLFGLAFFINAMHVSRSKSVLAGSLTLGLLVLPVVIRASEEALKSVPMAYKEASYSLGAGRWRTILAVILPAAMPGILTGTVISMGRAAGETAPIIFTAAVSVGKPLKLWEVFTQPTPALPWNIYNLATEHQAIDEIRHVQYGMVLTLVLLVLLLNLTAIILRARISKKLKG